MACRGNTLRSLEIFNKKILNPYANIWVLVYPNTTNIYVLCDTYVLHTLYKVYRVIALYG